MSVKSSRSARRAGWIAASLAALLVTPVLAPAVAAADDTAQPASTVAGLLQLPDRCPANGATIVLEWLRDKPTPPGTPLDTLAGAKADSLGRFTLDVPVTEEIVATAMRNGGMLNVAILAESTSRRGANPDACQAVASPTLNPDPGALLGPVDGADPIDTPAVTDQAERDPSYLLWHAFSLGLVNTDDGDQAMVFAPVNVGVLLLGEVTAPYTGALPDVAPNPTSSPQPGADLVSLGGTPVSPPGVNDPGTDVADLPQTNVAAQIPDEALTDNPAYAPPAENEAYDPYERCRQPENYNRAFTDVLGERTEDEPVGELHTGQDMSGTYVYGQTGNTTLGVGYTVEGKWKSGGTVAMKNDKKEGSEATLRVGQHFGAHVMSGFRYRKERITNCGSSCCSENDPQPYVWFRIRPLWWQGGAAGGPTDLTNWDTSAQLMRAWDKGWHARFDPGGTHRRLSGKGHTYTYEVQAFGVNLSAETPYSTETTLTLNMGTRLRDYYVWGNNGPPTTAPINYAFAQ